MTFCGTFFRAGNGRERVVVLPAAERGESREEMGGKESVVACPSVPPSDNRRAEGGNFPNFGKNIRPSTRSLSLLSVQPHLLKDVSGKNCNFASKGTGSSWRV